MAKSPAEVQRHVQAIRMRNYPGSAHPERARRQGWRYFAGVSGNVAGRMAQPIVRTSSTNAAGSSPSRQA